MPRIALLVSLQTAFGRRVLEGVASYCEREGATTRAAWQILSLEWGDVGLEDLESGFVEGVIGSITESGTLAMIRERSLPCVNLADHPVGLALPSVVNDATQTGRLAARHLLGRGERMLAVYGRKADQASERTILAFLDEARGRPVQRHEGRLTWAGRRRQEWEALLAWVKALPKPAAIFAVEDILARRVLQACLHLGFAVPDEVAVLGSGDLSLVNRLSLPPLSSVILSSFEIGYTAAHMLDHWLSSGEVPPGEPLLIAPAGVVARRSTDMLSVADPTVQAALTFIKEHLGQGLKVDDVAAHVAVSRRWLERKFLESLGRPPAAEIRRAQVERASQLLTDTQWSLAVIARQCGLSAPERLSVLFKRETGLTPGTYRGSARRA